MIIRDFALNEVKLTDPWLKNAFSLEKNYLMSLEADRLLAGFFETAGKTPKGKRYTGGWEDQDIAGHTMGHYLVALAQCYASTQEKLYLDRIEYVLQELSECQMESGYLSAFPEELFDKLEQGKPAWVPWYTMHKILSGLIRVYQLTGLPLALDIALRLGGWVSGRVNRWDEAMKARVLATEYGGMNDCLYELYKESGKIELMMAAEKFDEIGLFQEIYNGNDCLNGKHANTTIPKFLGALNRYLAVGEDQKFYLDAARRFFDIVVKNHTYVTGGNSEWEHFGEPKLLAGERTNCNCETCNTYNMLKLARGLFQVTGERHYLDFYEGTFWNAIVSSQNPKTGMSMYFQPMATGYFKVFSRPYDNFWCCTGTGMENFTKLNDSIYYKRDNVVYVAMYVSSCLEDTIFGIRITQEAELPANPVVKLHVEKESEGEIKLALRRPEWSRLVFSVTGVGKELKTEERGGFVFVELEKGSTDIEVVFAPEIGIHPLADNPNVVAFTYGHLVLSAGLGKEAMETSVTGVNVTVPTREISLKDTLTIKSGDVEGWLAQPELALVRQGDSLLFRLSGTEEDDSLVFSPHYERFEERYGIYWELIRKKEQEVTMPEKEEKKKVGNPFLIVLFVIVLILLLVTGFLVALEISEGFRNKVLGTEPANSGNLIVTENTSGNDDTEKQSEDVPGDSALNIVENNAGIGNGETQVPVATAAPVKIKMFYLENLEQEVALANQTEMNGFSAFVEQIGGKQYLSFSNGVYKVSYKNEVPPTTMSSVNLNEVIISNGTKTETFYWNYYADSGNVSVLCPKVGDYCKNGREQLVFCFKEQEDSKAESLHVVAGNNLLEYYVVSPEVTLENLIKINGFLDAGRGTLADITAENRNYYISLPYCLPELAEEVYPLKANAFLDYEITEEDILLESFVCFGDDRYIGKIQGSVAFSSRDIFRLTSPQFYVFAEDDYTDVDSVGICYPIEENKLHEKRVKVVGDGGERLLVRLQEEVAVHNYKKENFRPDENGFLAYYEDDVKKTLVGIDVSKWNNDVNWKKVAAAGVDYVMIRLGYRGTAAAGNCVIDPQYEKNIKGALEAGLQVGVYYFTQAITVEEAIEEANIVIENLKGYNITFPVVYDTEYSENARANSLSNAERTACVKAFCDTILAAGYTPVLYAGTNWSVLDMNLEELQGYDFWYAAYQEPEELQYPYNFTMWQYTSGGKVDGVPTEVDLNISFVDYSTR